MEFRRIEVVYKNLQEGVSIVLSISAIHSSRIVDSEHQRIIQELLQLGISPTYNKSADKALLAKAKAELIRKIQNKDDESKLSSHQVQSYSYQDDNEYQFRADLEEKRLGAMTLAELNKFFLLSA